MAHQSTHYTIKGLANVALGLFCLSAMAMGTAGYAGSGFGIVSRWQIQIGLSFLAWAYGLLALCFIKAEDGALTGYIGIVLLIVAGLEAQLAAIFLSYSPSQGLQLDYINEHTALAVAMACILSALFMLTVSLNSRGDWSLEYHAAVILTVFMISAYGASMLVSLRLRNVCDIMFAVCMFAWCAIVCFRLRELASSRSVIPLEL